MIPSLIGQTSNPYEGFFAVDKSYLRKALVSGMEERHGSHFHMTYHAVITAIKAICCAALDTLQHAFKAFAKTIGVLPYSFYWANQVEMPTFTPVHMLLDIPRHIVKAVAFLAMIVIAPIPAAIDPQQLLRYTKLLMLTPDPIAPKVANLPVQHSEIGIRASSRHVSKTGSTPAMAPELYEVRPVTESNTRFITDPIPQGDIPSNYAAEVAHETRINNLETAAAKTNSQLETITATLKGIVEREKKSNRQSNLFKASVASTLILGAAVHFASPSLGFTSPFTRLWQLIPPLTPS